MRKLVTFLLAFVMLLGLALPTTVPVQASEADWETAMNRSLDWIRNAVPSPVVGSVGGEWAVLALARANRVNANDPWVRAWLSDLDRTLSEVDRIAQTNDIHNPPSPGTFPSALRRWTDFQRVTIALSAVGIDASNYNGRDITEVFRSYVPNAQRHSLNQTINVDTFALIALDARNYSGDRDRFVDSMVSAQRADGSWSLSPGLATSPLDLDVTAMALQAIAPYYRSGDARVTQSVSRALGWLRSQTFADPESTGQMIVALTALGPGYANEAGEYVTWLLRWFDPASGGFRRPTPNDPVNHMATEQAAYALVAYWRFVNNMSPLYDMGNAGDGGTQPSVTPAVTPAVTPPADGSFGLAGRHNDIRRVGITTPNRTFGDIQNYANRGSIEALASRGIITGRSENAFAPTDTMTRAEFATIITRGLGLPDRPNNAQFTDVPADAWFAGSVGVAFYYEIISGTSPSIFNPNGTITRQEAAAMVTRAARLSGMDTNLGETETLNILAAFGDYRTAGDWAWPTLAFCYREGILDDSGFYIEPLSAITRGEIADMLYRMLGRADLL